MYPRKWRWKGVPLGTPDFALHVVVRSPGARCERFAPDGSFINYGTREEYLIGETWWEEVPYKDPDVEYFLRRLRAELYLENRAVQSKIPAGLRAGRERPQILQEGHIPQPR